MQHITQHNVKIQIIKSLQINNELILNLRFIRIKIYNLVDQLN
jgi:hypothetical protein